MLHALEYGQQLGMIDAGKAFQRAEKGLNSTANAFSALVVHFRSMPTVMTAGAFLPEFDYECRALQTLEPKTSARGYLSTFWQQTISLVLHDMAQGRSRP